MRATALGVRRAASPRPAPRRPSAARCSSCALEPLQHARRRLAVGAPRGARKPPERLAQRADVDVGALAQQVADVGVDRPRAAPPVAGTARDDGVLRRQMAAARARHEVLAREVAPPELSTAPHARATIALDQLFHRQRHPARLAREVGALALSIWRGAHVLWMIRAMVVAANETEVPT